MSGERLRCAVIGVGRIGRLHAQIYAQDPRTELIGITDVQPDVAASVGQELGVPTFSDVASVLNEAPDIVSVAVPEQHRLAPAIAAAEAGCHLLLEKPLSPTLEGTDQLIRELSGAAGKIMVNFILRSDPRYISVREAVAKGRLGDVCSLSAFRRGTAAGASLLGPWTGLLISTAIHDIDVMAWTVGARVERVYAEAVVRQSAQWGHEDVVLATLRFSNGAIGALDTSWILPTSVPAPLSSGFEVVGTGGSAAVRGTSHGLSILDEDGLTYPDLANWPVINGAVGGCLASNVARFVHCVLADEPPQSGLREARDAEAVVDAIRRSIREERPVSLSG